MGHFRLNQRTQSAGGRSIILSRGYAMTRGRVQALKEQLWAEAMRHGLGRANEVLIVADGVFWIWNLAEDRFPGARQRVDLWHVSQHLNYLKTHQHRMDYATARERGEPLGSGAIESTCRQYPVRFKRTGQYWSQQGDEALILKTAVERRRSAVPAAEDF